MTLADRIAIMKGGAIQQLAAPSEIYNRPGNRYVADFIGSPSMNFFEGVLDGTSFRTGEETFSTEGYAFSGQASGRASMGVRPEHVATGEAASAMPNAVDTTVEIVEPMGSDTLVWAPVAGTRFRIRIDGQQAIQPGDPIRIGFDPQRASFFDAETELRL